MPRHNVQIIPPMQPKMQHLIGTRPLVLSSKPFPLSSSFNCPLTRHDHRSSRITSILRCLTLGLACNASLLCSSKCFCLPRMQEVTFLLCHILWLSRQLCPDFVCCLDVVGLAVQLALLGRGKVGVSTTALSAVGLNGSTLLVGCGDRLGLGSKVTFDGTALYTSLAAVKEGGIFGGHGFRSSLKLGAYFGGDIFEVASSGQFRLHLGSGGAYMMLEQR